MQCEYCVKGKPFFRIVESYSFNNVDQDCCDLCVSSKCALEDKDDCMQYVAQTAWNDKDSKINLYIGIVDKNTMFYNGEPAIMYEDKTKPFPNKNYLPIKYCPICGKEL